MIYINKTYLKVANIWKNALLKIKPLEFMLNLMPAHNPCAPQHQTNLFFWLCARTGHLQALLVNQYIPEIGQWLHIIISLPTPPPQSQRKNWNSCGHKATQEFQVRNLFLQTECKCASLFSFNFCCAVSTKSVFSYILGHWSLHTCAEIKLIIICHFLVQGYSITCLPVNKHFEALLCLPTTLPFLQATSNPIYCKMHHQWF